MNLGVFHFQEDAAACTLHGYSVRTARDPKEFLEPSDAVDIVLAFNDPIGRAFDAIRRHRQNGSFAPVRFSGFYAGQFFYGTASIDRFDDPGNSGHGYVGILHMHTDWRQWSGPLAVDLPPIVQPEPERRVTAAHPVQGRLLTSVSPASAVGLSAFSVKRSDDTDAVVVTAQVTRSKTAFEGIRGFARAWPDKIWATVEGDWNGSRFDIKNVRCLECTDDGMIVLTCAAADFEAPQIPVSVD